MNRDQLSHIIEKIAVDFVLIDPSDTDELRSILSHFQEILVWAGEQNQPVLEKALSRIINLMSTELDQSSELPEPVYDMIGQSISIIQHHARNEYDFSHATFPFDHEPSPVLEDAPSMGLPHPDDEDIEIISDEAPTASREESRSVPSGLRHPNELPSHLDMELFDEFLSLQPPLLDKMETLILSFEQDHNPAALDEIKRMIHTQKGEAGFLNLKDIERLCHATEDLLESDHAVRNADLLFSVVDWIRLAYSWCKGESDARPLSVDDLIEFIYHINQDALSLQQNDDRPPTPDKPDGPKKPGLTEDSVSDLADRARKSTPSQTKDAILVDTERLDRIIDMIGELVIAETMVMQSKEIKSIQSQELNRHLAQMDKITRVLQETGLSLRMVPIRSTFQKVARLVRDISKKSGKTIQFLMQGEETELDKTIVDKIGEPLLHLIRNAMDHGIEEENQRLALGKPAQGTISIKAFHKSGNIQIEIEDDGRGLDKTSIVKKARGLKLITDDTALSERDIINLIFEPGFSTASEVTDLSGRGVGMSVVKTTIESLRGQVDIRSVEGNGSTFIIKIPLTLAIIDGMIVRTGRERFIIPTLAIITSTRIEPGSINTVANHGKMVKIHNQLIPLFKLSRLLDTQDDNQLEDPDLMVVVEGSNRRIALGVDELLGKQQIVIKSLGESMKNIPGISGAAIMPDGKVGLIIDIDKLTENHQMMST